MTDTPNLGLPLLAAAQAQKHVTHNDALMAIDALLNCAVLDKDLSAPPASPATAARYIVASPGSGAWAGRSGKIAVWQDGAWIYRTPKAGFLAFVLDEGLLYFHTGSAWVPLTSALGAIQNLALLGIGTTADAANPFSAKLNAALWTARATGEGGTGDLRYTLNKQAVANTLSFLFQSGYSGRLEMGLIGSDSPALKVSPNGTSWSTALSVDPATGGVDHLAASTDVASAATVDLGAQATLKVRITGTTAITSFGPGLHKLRLLHFAGSLTLTSGAALVCPGGASIVTQPGDTAITTSDSSGTWTIRHYTRAALAPGAASGAGGPFLPAADNANTLGSASVRWSDVWSTQYHVDPSFKMDLSLGANYPAMTWDTGDDCYFDRPSNNWTWRVGGASVLVFDAYSTRPGTDNAVALGSASRRWSTVYGGSGTINTSDQREKTQLRPFADAELDAWGEVSAGVYQHLDAVARKGPDHARIHHGYTAQAVEAAFRSHGLGPARYALWCSDALTRRVTRTRKGTRQATETVQVSETVIEIGQDGVPVQREVSRAVERPLTRDVPVVDASGRPVMVDHPRLDLNGRPLMREDGSPIIDRIPLTHPVPVAEEVEETYEVEEPVLDTDGTPMARLGLRYDQCAVIEAAWQRRRADRLEARVAALETPPAR